MNPPDSVRAGDVARVLIVDDTPANLRLMHVMLRGLALDITAAASGAEALEQVRAQEFAVILLDVRMQNMDGYQTAINIRALEKDNLRLTPIIFVTAEYQTEVQVRKGYSVGAVDYLLKPIVREILIAKVMFFIELFDTRRQLHARIVHEQYLNQILRELEFARDIQRSILPAHPQHPGVDVFAALETAREVGGDFYDFAACHIGQDKRLCAVVGDVMGKGMPASLVMVMALTVLRESTRVSGSPRDILKRSNTVLYERLKAMHTSNAVTATCISLDLENGTMYHARAGHENLLFWSRRQGRVQPLSVPGYTLGLFEDGGYEELVVPVEAGDKIVLYTDGITEARSANRQFFTQERLADLVAAHADEPVKVLGPRLLEAVSAFQGQTLLDDIALLIVEIL